MSEWAAPDFSRSRAVLIGTSDYTNLPPVPAAAHSLHRMHGLLTGPLCGWPADRVELILNERAPGDLPDRLVDLYVDATDVALFYYVGHGQPDPKDRLCLSLVDSRDQAERRWTTSLTFDAVRDALDISRAEVKIVFLDCCYAGLALTGEGTLGTIDMMQATRGTGAYTVAASGPFNTAWFETDPDSHTPQTYFTKHLAEVVERGIVGEPEVLTLSTVVEHLTEDLASHGKPLPTHRARDFASRFPFARNIAATPPPAGRETTPTAAAVVEKPETHRKIEPRPRINRPGMLAALMLATAVSLVQLGQMQGDLTVRLQTGLFGVAFFAVVPIVAATGLVTSLRQRARNWSIGMTSVLVIWTGLFVSANLDGDAGPTALAGFYTYGPDQPPEVGVFVVDLAGRLLAGAAGTFWYAIRGPRPTYRRLPSWGHHPGLLLAAAGATVLSLAGAIALSTGATAGNHAIFDLFGSARLNDSSNAVVGVGNVLRTGPNGLDTASAVWNLGWLALVATAVTGTVVALRRRQVWWTTSMLASVAMSLVIGLAAADFYESAAGVSGLALILTAMTTTAAGAVVAYGWRGPQNHHRATGPRST